MHFWSSSQGCGYNRRHPSISGYGRNQRFSSGYHSKPMVTPIHRFQSLPTNGTRQSRPPGSSTRCTGYAPRYIMPPTTFGSLSEIPSFDPDALDPVQSAPSHSSTSTLRRRHSPTAKFKCGVWLFFAVVTFFVVGAKYYFHGVNIGMEALAFCSLLVILLIIGGLVSLYEAITTAANTIQGEASFTPATPMVQSETNANQLPNNNPSNSVELPPPPYHIAVMLPHDNDPNATHVLIDSPPPSYEKAVP